MTKREYGKLRLLVTSAGSLVATNLLESLSTLGRERFFIAGTNSVSEAAGNFVCDAVLRVPPTEDRDAWMRTLRSWGDEIRPDLWIPTRDDDVCALAMLAAEMPLTGRALVGSPEVADLIADKWRSFVFAEAHRLPVVRTAADLEGAEALAAAHGFPLIVKPRRGYGSRGTRLVFDEGQLRRLLANGHWVVQPFVHPAPGWERSLPDPAYGMPLWYSYEDPGQYSVVALVRPDGVAELVGATLNTMVCGRPERTVREENPDLLGLGQAYAEALARDGWRGPVNVQCRRLPDGRFEMFELAGRFAGGLGGREAVGFDEVCQVLAAWCPAAAVPAARVPDRGPSSVAVKQPCTVALSRSALEAFEREGRWLRSS